MEIGKNVIGKKHYVKVDYVDKDPYEATHQMKVDSKGGIFVNGVPVGGIDFYIDKRKKVVIIEYMYMEEKGKGYGSRALKILEERWRKKGIKYVVVREVLPSTEAQGFWMSKGYWYTYDPEEDSKEIGVRLKLGDYFKSLKIKKNNQIDMTLGLKKFLNQTVSKEFKKG